MAKIDKLISDILKSYKVDPREACWDCHGTWVIYHRYLERIADKAGITFDAPELIHVDAKAKECVMLVTGYKGDKSAWSIGEVMPYNNKNSYPFAMAEKRGKDRVILKLAGLSGHVYSEEEADDFKVRPPAPRAKIEEKAEPVAAPAEKRAVPRPAPPAPPINKELKTSAPAYNFSLDERIKMVQDCLMKAEEGMGRAAILKETKLTTAQFNDTIGALKEDGKVEKTGEKRGTKWHWVADKEFPPEAAVDVKAPFAPPKKSPPPNMHINPIPRSVLVSERELDDVVDKVIYSGVGYIDIANLVRELTGCNSARQAYEEGKLTQDVLSRISELA